MTSLPDPHVSAGRRDDHAEIEALLEGVLTATEAEADLTELREQWARLARAVETHFQMEERVVFRRASAYDVEELLWLWRDHGELRDRIERMTAELERRALRPDALRAFRDKLRAHAELEDRTAYVWATWDRR
jgi:hypothetical protein